MTKAARRPKAARAYTYLPPACGYRVASSAKTRAPRNPTAPPRVHATKVRPGRPRRDATVPGVRKMPEPTMMPTTTASPSTIRRLRASLCTGAVNTNRSARAGAVSSPRADDPDVDLVSEVELAGVLEQD